MLIKGTIRQLVLVALDAQEAMLGEVAVHASNVIGDCAVAI